jgi:hypothetical protein
MSHFVVLVTGEDYEAALAPYNENDEYYQTDVEYEGTDDECCYNPDGKWDWYEKGGRWSGMLLHKNGERVDQLRKKDLDLEGMERKAVENARLLFDAYASIFAGKEIPKRSSARSHAEYESHPLVQAIRDQEQAYIAMGAPYRLPWLCMHTNFYGGDREAMTKHAGYEILTPYATLHEDEWLEGGGSWFSPSSLGWGKTVRSLIESLAPDTLITVVDCHQ